MVVAVLLEDECADLFEDVAAAPAPVVVLAIAVTLTLALWTVLS
jgi:hypothetical protein